MKQSSIDGPQWLPEHAKVYRGPDRSGWTLNLSERTGPYTITHWPAWDGLGERPESETWTIEEPAE